MTSREAEFVMRLMQQCCAVQWASSTCFISLLKNRSVCPDCVFRELSGRSIHCICLFVPRYWWMCDPDALLPIQHGVCQPARQPSLWLSARLHQSGRILLHWYVCMHANTLLTHQILSHNGTHISVKYSCIDQESLLRVQTSPDLAWKITHNS